MDQFIAIEISPFDSLVADNPPETVKMRLQRHKEDGGGAAVAALPPEMATSCRRNFPV
jgi:hypothetical protein